MEKKKCNCGPKCSCKEKFNCGPKCSCNDKKKSSKKSKNCSW